jgi:hypothetical protein
MHEVLRKYLTTFENELAKADESERLKFVTSVHRRFVERGNVINYVYDSLKSIADCELPMRNAQVTVVAPTGMVE